MYILCRAFEMRIQYCELQYLFKFLIVQMKPTLAKTKQNVDNSSTNSSSKIRLKNKGCPPGTVPIKRITKDDLIRQKNMSPPEDVTFNAQLVVVR